MQDQLTLFRQTRVLVVVVHSGCERIVMQQPFASHSFRHQKGGWMQSEPSRFRRQSLEEKAVALLSQDVDRLSRATQSCIPAGDLSQARGKSCCPGVTAPRSRGASPRNRPVRFSTALSHRRRCCTPCISKTGRSSLPSALSRMRASVSAGLYRVGWRYRWLCYRCGQTQFPASVPLSPGDVED